VFKNQVNLHFETTFYSDGLSDYVCTDIIRRDSHSAEKLLQDALEQGAPDNVTIIIIDILP